MRLIEVSVSVLVVSLIVVVVTFCYLSANRSFETVRNSSIRIRTVVKTDMRIRALIENFDYSYLDSKKKVSKELAERIKAEDLGEAEVTDVKIVFENTSDIYSPATIKVSWLLGGKEYTSYEVF